MTESSPAKTENGKDANAKESKTVPYDRFQKVSQEKKYYKEEVNSLKNEISEIKSMLKESKKVDTSDMTPSEFEKHVRDQIKAEMDLEKAQEAQKVKEAEKFITEFFDDLKDEGEEFDENEVMKLAVEEFDNDLPKAWKAYKREQKALKSVTSEKSKQKAKDGESLSAKKGSDVKSPK